MNVDAANKNVREKNQVKPGVRRFLLAMRVSWPTVMNGDGADDFAKAYGVTDIPANFLIDQSGKIIAVELSDVDLDQAIAKAVGADKDDDKGKDDEKKCR